MWVILKKSWLNYKKGDFLDLVEMKAKELIERKIAKASDGDPREKMRVPKRDKEFEEAIKNGDKARVRKMLKEYRNKMMKKGKNK